jgi:hypothetical protein
MPHWCLEVTTGNFLVLNHRINLMILSVRLQIKSLHNQGQAIEK